MTFTLADFPQTWLDDWNSHDVERILAHYDPAVRFQSPFAAILTGSGAIEGKDALRAYWAPALASRPGLRFHVKQAYIGHRGVAIHYGDEHDRSVIETLVFNDDDRIIFGTACYATPPAQG